MLTCMCETCQLIISLPIRILYGLDPFMAAECLPGQLGSPLKLFQSLHDPGRLPQAMGMAKDIDCMLDSRGLSSTSEAH